eukprot:gene18207-28050_t
MHVEKRAAAHQDTVDALEASLTRKQQQLVVDLQRSATFEGAWSEREGTAKRRRVKEARRLREDGAAWEARRRGRLLELSHDRTARDRENASRWTDRHDHAARVRDVLHQAAAEQAKEDESRRREVKLRKRERLADAQSQHDALSGRVAEKRRPRAAPPPELHPFQGRPVRNIPRGRVKLSPTPIAKLARPQSCPGR